MRWEPVRWEQVLTGGLVPVLPAVYRSAATPLTTAGREWAAALWSGGIVSHASAARRWELPTATPDQVHVSVVDLAFRRRPVP